MFRVVSTTIIFGTRYEHYIRSILCNRYIPLCYYHSQPKDLSTIYYCCRNGCQVARQPLRQDSLSRQCEKSSSNVNQQKHNSLPRFTSAPRNVGTVPEKLLNDRTQIGKAGKLP
jgi:hypothetical protein